MHPLLIPLALLAASLFAKKQPAAPAGTGPRPNPPPGGTIRMPSGPVQTKPPQPTAARPITAKPIRTDPYPPQPQITIEHPNVIPAEAAQQAAVDATVSHAIRTEEAAPVNAKAKAAANALLQFLIKTGRFGGGKDKPAEVKAAQRDLGVKPDGIVGPKTRTAALNQGVALPPKP